MAEKPEHCYPYARPALTVDLVVFSGTSTEPSILLIKRKYPPFAGQWALPGGFVEEGETLEEAALRELAEETNLTGVNLNPIGAFADPGRDPRGWTVSIAFSAIRRDCITPQAGDDAGEAAWWASSNLPALAFDHRKIINTALDQLSGK